MAKHTKQRSGELEETLVFETPDEPNPFAAIHSTVASEIISALKTLEGSKDFAFNSQLGKHEVSRIPVSMVETVRTKLHDMVVGGGTLTLKEVT